MRVHGSRVGCSPSPVFTRLVGVAIFAPSRLLSGGRAIISLPPSLSPSLYLSRSSLSLSSLLEPRAGLFAQFYKECSAPRVCSQACGRLRACSPSLLRHRHTHPRESVGRQKDSPTNPHALPRPTLHSHTTPSLAYTRKLRLWSQSTPALLDHM